MDDLDALRRFSEATRIPTAASETLGTRWSFRELIQRGNRRRGYFRSGLGRWDHRGKAICSHGGGLQASGRPARLQRPGRVHYLRPPDDNAPNAIFQEMVRAFYTGWYEELVTELPRVENGFVYPLTGPGLGTSLRPEVFTRPDARIVVSDLADLGSRTLAAAG